MATDFMTPRLPGQHQHTPYYATAQSQRQQYRPQQLPSFQPSPITTTHPAFTPYNTPVSPLGTPGAGSISPTASKNRNRPLYVPAVLRPTEFPSKEPPARPNLENEEEDGATEEGLRPNSSFMSLGGLSAFGRLSRRSTGDSTKGSSNDWDLEQFPKPTGMPTREHWKPDQESTICDHATCKRHFSYFTRRHHCRKCGNIFCDQHSAFEIPLDQDANFNPRGVPSRACGHCYAQFREWRSLAMTNNSHRRRASTPGDLHSDGHGQLIHGAASSSSPVSTSPVNGLNGLQVPPHVPDAAHSVPRDWNWSTF
ncbi:uncharacterized protein B0T15DRAFT_302358 [Chaetomium strumarium]|uniref:FYVE-type domain-containing protein n=1 Tax=Chaetomium strumarium TaxID=1170767 RepID=A0AAJ0GLY5_9PEZI|nr:hypothetical protein B0T15DRAFT_302358 [Chaetomium strumarium]